MFFGETYPSFTRKNCLFIDGLKEFISLLVNSLNKPSVKYIAVIAYPAFRPAEVAMKPVLRSVKPSNAITKFLVGKPDSMLDGDLKTALTFGATKGDYRSYGIDFEFEKPFEASSVFVNLKWSWFYPKNVFLLVSDDGKNFREIAELKFEKYSNEVYIKIPSTTAKYWRVEKRTSPSPTHYGQIRMNIGEIELIPSGTVPRNASFIPLFMVKVAADRSNIGFLPRGVEPVPAKAVIDPKKIIFVKEKISADGTMQWRVCNILRATTTLLSTYVQDLPAEPARVR